MVGRNLSASLPSTSGRAHQRTSLKDQVKSMRRSRADFHLGKQNHLRHSRLRSLSRGRIACTPRKKRANKGAPVPQGAGKLRTVKGATEFRNRKRPNKNARDNQNNMVVPLTSKKRKKTVKSKKVKRVKCVLSDSEESSTSVTSEDEDSSSSSFKLPSKSYGKLSKKQIHKLFDNSSDNSSSSDSDENDNLGIFTDTVSTSISKQTKRKIWNREYINLAKLYYGKESNNLSMFMKKSKSNTVTSLKRAPQRQINNILSWCRAFQLYASIYTKKYPKQGSGMFQYMSIVQTLAHKGQNWLLYDQKFRQLRAKRQLPWSRLHVQTHLFQSLSKAPSSYQQSQQKGGVQSSNVIFNQNQGSAVLQQRHIFRRGYCWTFQRHGKCMRTGCSRLHKCAMCNGQHGGSTCSTSSQYGNQQTQGNSFSTSAEPSNPSKS